MGANCPKKVCSVLGPAQQKDYLVTGAINGVEWSRLKLDSGAQHTLVRAETVKDEDYTGDSVALRMADGKESHLPLAVIHL